MKTSEKYFKFEGNCRVPAGTFNYNSDCPVFIMGESVKFFIRKRLYSYAVIQFYVLKIQVYRYAVLNFGDSFGIEFFVIYESKSVLISMIRVLLIQGQSSKDIG